MVARRLLALALVILPAATASAAGPIVYVQAGHEGPREPGYRAQTGAAGEVAFNQRVAANVERRLRKAGVDARHTTGLVTPLGAPAAVFVSIHHDTPDGRAAIGHAIAGAGENYYRGEGFGAPRSTPYADSAPHRPGTRVSPAVQRTSRRLATRLATRYGAVFTRANGARSGRVQLVAPNGNRRMTRFYGYYRTTAEARVLIECGAGGTDATMLRRKEIIGAAIADSIVAHLVAEGKLPAQA